MEGAPQLEFFAGRRNATAPAIDGLIPLPQDNATAILTRFADVGLTPFDLVSLLAAHSVGRASHVDPGLIDAPFDTVRTSSLFTR